MSWLVSPRFDLAVFGGPAVVALGLVALEGLIAPTGETSLPWWVLTIVCVDVAHVWTTIYRTYLDTTELRRRPLLYAGAPLAAYLLGAALHAISSATFWTVLAYLAVFHFVRQQYGWVVLYNRRAGDQTRLDRWIDGIAIYAATVFPILWWHANLPRRFEWFIAGDFITAAVPGAIVSVGAAVYVTALSAFGLRQLTRWRREGLVRWGKVTVVVTTALCWGVGIIVTNTDWAFTVTNVLIHGIPYGAIVWVYGRRTEHAEGTFGGWLFGGRHVFVFYAVVVALAFVEELGWDRLVWHEHPSLFALPAVDLPSALLTLVVPLLALPQATHYILDAFIWRTRGSQNPGLAGAMHLAGGAASHRDHVGA